MRMIDTALESPNVLLLDDKILDTSGVPYVFVIFHLQLTMKCFIQEFDWKNVIFGYHAYQYGTQNYSSRKVWYLGFPTPWLQSLQIYWIKAYKALNISDLINVIGHSKMWTFRWKYSKFTTTHKRIQTFEKCIGDGIGKLRYHTFLDE